MMDQCLKCSTEFKSGTEHKCKQPITRWEYTDMDIIEGQS